MNEIATKKIVTLFMQEYFMECDNVVDKGLDMFLEKLNFSKRKNLARF